MGLINRLRWIYLSVTLSAVLAVPFPVLAVHTPCLDDTGKQEAPFLLAVIF